MLAARATGPTAWSFVEANWAAIVARIPDNAVARMVDGVSQRSEPDTVAAITRFLGPGGQVAIPQGAKLVAQSLERMNVLVLLRGRAADTLAARFVTP
jgi:nicotinamide mononucleotide (NMN) deamidase PncC